jgi:hypothetical protein
MSIRDLHVPVTFPLIEELRLVPSLHLHWQVGVNGASSRPVVASRWTVELPANGRYKEYTMEFSKKTMAFEMKFRACELSWRPWRRSPPHTIPRIASFLPQGDPKSTTCLSPCSLSDKYRYFYSFQIYKLVGYATSCFSMY